jgi:hypothetical protein
LQGAHRLDGVGAADGFNSCLRESEVLYLPLLDQVLYGAGNVFDGHVRIDAVLVEQIDSVGLEAFEGSFGDFFDVRRLLSSPDCLPVSGSSLNPNLVAITARSRKGARPSPTSSSLVNGP